MNLFGLLYLNKGIWNGQEIISQKWIKKSVASNTYHYCYLWWLGTERGINSYAALGSRG